MSKPIPKTDIQVQLSGENGNIFVLRAKVANALKRGGHADLVDEMNKKVTASESYDAALRVLMEYVDVT